MDAVQRRSVYSSSHDLGGVQSGEGIFKNVSGLKQDILTSSPPYSECAYVAKRPLSWAVWIKGFSQAAKGSFLDRYNKEFSHEHIIFEQSGENIGFGPEGLFREDVTSYNYRLDSPCFDGARMRQAVSLTQEPRTYFFLFNNCQSFVERVKQVYNLLQSGSTDKL
jgi:hypothetical protein